MFSSRMRFIAPASDPVSKPASALVLMSHAFCLRVDGFFRLVQMLCCAFVEMLLPSTRFLIGLWRIATWWLSFEIRLRLVDVSVLGLWLGGRSVGGCSGSLPRAVLVKPNHKE
ncbi:hypothetical protein F2Q69_00061330 [Brassica cretica]|uniref:Uncharacterized protein n=1 Tax=Brassica cretica TaxID=69181 RepID=A0A8S9RFH9_BRACR|nr:hypothetical protein F2Q69_00061330 [Brassica cretica]